MKTQRTLRIVTAIPIHAKAGRSRLAGILRFSGTHHDWAVNIIDSTTILQLPPERRLKYLLHAEPDGIICATYAIRNAITETYNADVSPFKRMPIVFLDAPSDTISNIPNVHMNNRAIGRSAAEFFIRRGYKSLAYIGTTLPSELAYDRIRELGYTERAAKEGIDAKSFHAISDATDKTALAELTSFFKNLSRPCGVFTYSDRISMVTLEAVKRAQLQVPEQIAIIGVDDDTDLCNNTTPTLSSIALDFENAGYQAAEILDKLIHGSKPPRTDILYGVNDIVQRDSTTDLRGGGRLVSLATAYIEDHFKGKITVEDIAKHLNVSRRLLELRYSEINGTTVQNAILTLRLERVLKLLHTTHKPLGEIAALAGFNNYTSLAILFKRRYGHSMGEERSLFGRSRR